MAHSASLLWILLSWSSGPSPRGPGSAHKGYWPVTQATWSLVHSATPPPQQGHRRTVAFSTTATALLSTNLPSWEQGRPTQRPIW